MFTLNWGDWARGLVVAILAPAFVAVTVTVGTIIGTPHFDVFMVDWTTLAHSLINVSIVTAYGGFMGYIGKNLLTTDSGKALGIIGK